MAAAITTGAAVAAAAINRAATDDCWGMCSHGYICEPKSGKCIPISELEPPPAPSPEEAWDDGCIQEDDGRWLCPNDPETYATASADPPCPPCDGGDECDPGCAEPGAGGSPAP